MLLYPDVMRRAQAEIDQVVGRERMPKFDDMDHLSYIQAIVRETLRWKTMVPLGMMIRYTFPRDEALNANSRCTSSYYQGTYVIWDDYCSWSVIL